MLDLALGAEAGVDLIEVGIDVARMADELPCAFGWEVLEELAEHGSVELAGSGYAEGAVGRGDEAVAEVGVDSEAALEGGVEQADLKSSERSAVSEGEAPRWLEGVADGVDVGDVCGFEDGSADGGEEVGVLMCIKVGYR